MSPIRLRLTELRTRQGLTMAQLAKKAGVRVATISDMENRTNRRLDLRVLEKLCRALKCEPGGLLHWDRR